MDDAERILQTVRKSLLRDPRADIAGHPLTLIWEDGNLTIEGEVADIAAKKLVLERAAALPRVEAIIDRLRVAPAHPMGDAAIRDSVRDALLQEPALAAYAIYAMDKGQRQTVRVPSTTDGSITIAVSGGVVTLDGEVLGLGQKRLAGVLAWWIPGARDVVNGLGVTPPELDTDDEITDSVRLVLEKDPFVNSDQIRVTTRRSIVTLQGLARTSSAREMAEFDAWYVFGVDKVVNLIEVRA